MFKAPHEYKIPKASRGTLTEGGYFENDAVCCVARSSKCIAYVLQTRKLMYGK